MQDEQLKSFCGHLKNLRTSQNLSLRAVEKMTEKAVSNAYLSQLENGQIKSPSANMLFSLAQAYGVEYQSLMEKAGYILTKSNTDDSTKHGRAATFAVENLTSDEEQELLNYLDFIRKKGK